MFIKPTSLIHSLLPAGTALALVLSCAPTSAAASPARSPGGRPAGPTRPSAVSVSSPATVVPAGCHFEEATGDAVASAVTTTNSTRGFVSFGGGTCARPAFAGTLRYFDGHDATWRRATSPYTGRVLGVADDTTGTYALFSNQNGIWVGKRTTAGAFTKPVRLSTRGNGGAVLPQGDIVAQGGGYWAVWTEQVGPGGEFAQQELFQAKTLGAGACTGAISRQRITTHNRDDANPSLVLVPATAGRSGAHLAWDRSDGAQGTSSWLMYARSGCNGRWAVRTLFQVGIHQGPDMARSGSIDYLAWDHDARLAEAEISLAPFRSTTFAQPAAGNAHVSVSGSTVVALFESNGRLATRERHSGVWSLRYLTAAGARQQAVAATSFRSVFTALGLSTNDRLYAITVQ